MHHLATIHKFGIGVVIEVSNVNAVKVRHVHLCQVAGNTV